MGFLLIFLVSAVLGVGFLLFSVGVTVLIETPVIVRRGVTGNKKYIRAVNTLTNVIFNMVLTGILVIGGFPLTPATVTVIAVAWYALAELIAIPVFEAYAYKKISSLEWKKILISTYIANFLSCAVGILLDGLIFVIFFWGRL